VVCAVIFEEQLSTLTFAQAALRGERHSERTGGRIPVSALQKKVRGT
jgi:hypothetical protein